MPLELAQGIDTVNSSNYIQAAFFVFSVSREILLLLDLCDRRGRLTRIQIIYG
jgi:hypothetical protein